MASESAVLLLPQKRPPSQLDPDPGVTEAKRARNDINVINESKNPVAVLNELREGLKYNVVEQSGPCHAPIFKIAVEVDGQTYLGEGGSKKAAKCKAAEEALKSFIQFPNNTNAVYTSPNSNKIDFTSDAFEAGEKEITVLNTKKPMLKSPVTILNELFRNVSYTCENNESCPYSRFKVTVTLGDEKFYGSGTKQGRGKGIN